MVLLLALLAGCGAPPDALRIDVVSGPAEWVSGGMARLQIAGSAATEAVLTLNGEPVEGFAPNGDGVLEGVLTALRDGANTVEARAGSAKASITLTNYPIEGPMFSGPAQTPFVCASEEHRARARLGAPVDADCTIPTAVDFVYRSTLDDDWKPYDPAGPRPADLAQTTTLDGETVDFIVRWERGTINRFIYSIAMLSPASQEAGAPDLSAWNRRVIYAFQGGVGIGHYQGNPSPGDMLYPYGLETGYAILYSTGTRTSTHYDLQVGGETALMVKNRFVAAYGTPLYTVGVGGSGGGIQQYVYGQNHPGLIDAGVPQYAYPDMITQTIHVGDCELLERYMDAEVAKDPASKWATWSNRPWLEGMNASDLLPNRYNGDRPGLTECIRGWRGLTPLTFNPHYGTAPGISAEDQASTEWTHFGDLVQIYGTNADGYARRTWDNVGVQYGLQALLDGHISPDEFIDLNARIGGWKPAKESVQEGQPYLPEGGLDIHSARNMTLSPNDAGDPPAPRTTADAGAIEAAYTSGMVFTGQIDIPLIDWRHYLEEVLDMHNSHQSFAIRQRMLNHDGDAANQVVWFTDTGTDRERYDQTPLAFQVIDEWMANLRDHPERGVAGNKPDRAVDSCYDVDGSLIYSGPDAWNGILDDRPKGPCAERFPVYRTSRIVAGGPITGDVFKCQLQPIDDAVRQGLYGAWEMSPQQRTRMEAIFPEGVCDYTRPDARRPPLP
ncbi:MAG: DUF6351 family protein [Rhodothermales bacterium]